LQHNHTALREDVKRKIKIAMERQPVVIKKYENRRLYDSTNSRYINLEEVAQMVQEGREVQVVDAASGAVGSAVGQLAKSRGCRVVGLAGGSDKCAYVRDELGFDACIDYKQHQDLESLSQALPDDTYLTELHVADRKLEITGVTHEAASLIRIIEQTDQFKHATFFAPTTRAPLEIGEQFHIEAQIAPYFPATFP